MLRLKGTHVGMGLQSRGWGCSPGLGICQPRGNILFAPGLTDPSLAWEEPLNAALVADNECLASGDVEARLFPAAFAPNWSDEALPVVYSSHRTS